MNRLQQRLDNSCTCFTTLWANPSCFMDLYPSIIHRYFSSRPFSKTWVWKLLDQNLWTNCCQVIYKKKGSASLFADAEFQLPSLGSLVGGTALSPSLGVFSQQILKPQSNCASIFFILACKSLQSWIFLEINIYKTQGLTKKTNVG